jgi:hypothetical protein
MNWIARADRVSRMADSSHCACFSMLVCALTDPDDVDVRSPSKNRIVILETTVMSSALPREEPYQLTRNSPDGQAHPLLALLCNTEMQ